jgi:hypothetical protein
VLRDDGGDSDQGSARTPASTRAGGGSGGEPAGSPIPVIRLRGGEPVGGVEELQVTSGDPVRFRVRSDTGGEVHVHGYEREKPINPGGSVSFDFPADLEGGFEVELHHGGGESQIAELRVVPG